MPRGWRSRKKAGGASRGGGRRSLGARRWGEPTRGGEGSNEQRGLIEKGELAGEGVSAAFDGEPGRVGRMSEGDGELEASSR